jgi:hypothetical protein
MVPRGRNERDLTSPFLSARGTGFAVRDIEVPQLSGRVGGVEQTAEINLTGIAGFLLANVRRLTRVANLRTGTTSPTCSSTTMRGDPQPRLLSCSKSSNPTCTAS